MAHEQQSGSGHTVDLVHLCAAGEAAFQRAVHLGLGRPWIDGDRLAWAPDGPGHRFLFAAVTLAPRPALPDGLRGRVCDSFAALKAEDLPGPGWWSEDADPWIVRPPLPVPAPALAPGLRIGRVETDDEMVIFERTAFVAAGGRPPVRVGELHPAGSQRTPGLHFFVAGIDGHPAGTALAMDYQLGVLISAVAVLPQARRRGVGAALTVTALQVAPGRPAPLFATGAGLPVYQRLGFVEIGRHRDWHAPRTAAEGGTTE
jgi:GNAT superfamily N-acetyltransferase